MDIVTRPAESKTTHTPGPWRVEEMGNLYVTSSQGDIAIVRNIPKADGAEVGNAQLIASAPDLKLVLTAYYHALESYGNGSEQLAKECADAALAVLLKAEGRS